MRDSVKAPLKIFLHLLHFTHRIKLVVFGLIALGVIALIIYDQFYRKEEKALLKRELSKGIWITANLRFDTVNVEPDIHYLQAKGKFLKFDTNEVVRLITPQYIILSKDSIFPMEGFGVMIGHYSTLFSYDKVTADYDSTAQARHEPEEKVFTLWISKRNRLRESYTLMGDTLMTTTEKFVRTSLVKKIFAAAFEGKTKVRILSY